MAKPKHRDADEATLVFAAYNTHTVHCGPPPRLRNTVIGEFIGIPPEPRTDSDPATRQVIKRGDGFCQRDRVGLGRQRHRGGEPDPRRGHRRSCQRDPGVEGPLVAVVRQRSVAGAGVSGFPPDGDVGVLRHVEGIEAVLLSAALAA